MQGDGSDFRKLFHPVLWKWFLDKFSQPTDVQEKAWPVIGQGKHVLVTAPTGNGKTLAAFLWALNSLVTGQWEPGRLSVLYISPLKALNNDIRTNLLAPLEELKARFYAEGLRFPAIRVMTRSGDTPQDERRRMVKAPPEILITTPESLNLLLCSVKVLPVLTSIRTVILDEIHALASSKRGTHLITAVERLTLLSGEFQRIALSATVKPLDVIADFVGGWRLEAGGYVRRDVEVIRAASVKKIELNVCFPEDARDTLEDRSWWPALIREFKRSIKKNRSTLIFTNTRKLSEKVALLLNEGEDELIAYAHHGSLSRELRSVVEKKLKQGELSAIVATNSLELGIDIGSLDEVIMVQTPLTVSSAFQKIGRAGHSVGEVSRGRIVPTHGRDFLEAAVMARCVMAGDIEESIPVSGALDVLAQVILAMTGVESWNEDELFLFFKRCYPYHNLGRREFDLVLNMLNGRYGNTGIRELSSRLIRDPLSNTIKAAKGVLPLLYMSGGTIPDRGYFDLRVKDSGSRIGELDEEFVWEHRVGNVFHLGSGNWKIVHMDHKSVEVIPWEGRSGNIPFWKGERDVSDFHFYEKLSLFLEEWSGRIDSPDFKEELMRGCYLDKVAADELVVFLKRQQEATGPVLPHRHHLLVERYADRTYQETHSTVILHTMWGGRVNYPLALVLGAALEEKYGFQPEVVSDNSCVLILLPEEQSGFNITSLLSSVDVERLLSMKLERTGFFGARFRENAGRAMLLPRFGFNSRLPLWLNRLRSRKLLETVQGFKDFPLIVETWRECVHDFFNIPRLKQLLDELASGEIRLSEAATDHASPLAAGLVWRQVEKNMYEGDTPTSGKSSVPERDLLETVIFSSSLRPLLDHELIHEFLQKVRRLAPGYSPSGPDELQEWLKRRVFLLPDEWMELSEAVMRDNGLALDSVLRRTAEISLPGGVTVIGAVESLPFLSAALGQELLPFRLMSSPSRKEQQAFDNYLESAFRELAGEEGLFDELLIVFLSFCGPVSPDFLYSLLGAEASEAALINGMECGLFLKGVFRKGAEEEFLLKENLEILLRMKRRRDKPAFDALDLSLLPLFTASVQGLLHPANSEEALKDVLEQLFGFTGNADLWEKDFLPVRIRGYKGEWLDRLMEQVVWFGSGVKRIGFAFPQDLELFMPHAENLDASLFPGFHGKFGFWDLKEHSGLDSGQLTDVLWSEAWKGRCSCDSFDALRKGLASGFKAQSGLPPGGGRPNRRSGFQRWQASRPAGGAWFALEAGSGTQDALEEEELVRDRTRQLLRRYGILFRELLVHEVPLLQWGRIFRSLRLMEFSGEVLSGYFFKGIPGPQFISPKAFDRLKAGFFDDQVFFLNACDPASLCGKGLKDLDLPSRLPTTHLVYHGPCIVLVSLKNGRELIFNVSPDSSAIKRYCALFLMLLSREFAPCKVVKVDRINDLPAAESPYCQGLLDFGFRREYKTLLLYRAY